MTLLTGIKKKADHAIISAKCRFASLLNKKEDGFDQIVTVFIIIAIATGLAAIVYLFARNTIVPNLNDKLNNTLTDWFESK